MYLIKAGGGMRAAVALVMGLACMGQQQQQQAGGERGEQGEEVRPMRPGFHVNGLGAYFGGYALAFPAQLGFAAQKPIYLGAGGGVADFSYIAPLKTNSFRMDYQGGYFRNQRFDEMNGFDHAFRMNLRSDNARRTVFGLEAVGESQLISTALFSSTSLRPGIGLPGEAGSTPLEDLSSSPLALLISGTRRTMGGVYLSMNHNLSRRTVFNIRGGAARDIRSAPRDLRLAGYYPSLTLGSADANITRSLSRRLRAVFGGSYLRSLSRNYVFDAETAGVGLEGSIGVASFARVEGGYGRAGFPGAGRNTRQGYNAAAVIGTTKNYNTVSLEFRRSVADLRGLTAGSTLEGDAVWAWQKVGSPWTFGSSMAYMRLGGMPQGRFDAWVWRSRMSKRLGSQFVMAIEGAWAAGYVGNFMDYQRRGVRVSLLWSPDPDARR